MLGWNIGYYNSVAYQAVSGTLLNDVVLVLYLGFFLYFLQPKNPPEYKTVDPKIEVGSL